MVSAEHCSISTQMSESAKKAPVKNSAYSANARKNDQSEVSALRMRVQFLEEEVAGYKQRLDVLRKAKNDVVIRKETVYEQTGAPFSSNRRIGELENQLTAANREHAEEISKVKARYEEEIKKLTASYEDAQQARVTSASKRDSQDRIAELEEKLRKQQSEIDKWKRNADLWLIQNKSTQRNLDVLRKDYKRLSEESEAGSSGVERPKSELVSVALASPANRGDRDSTFSERDLQMLQDLVLALQLQNDDLQKVCEQFRAQLSERLANTTDARERYRSQQSWQARYDEWMSVTQQKLDELQFMNAALKARVRELEGEDASSNSERRRGTNQQDSPRN